LKVALRPKSPIGAGGNSAPSSTALRLDVDDDGESRGPVGATRVAGISASNRSGVYLRKYRESHEKIQTAVERLSTGKRINRPSDDPSGFITAELLRGEISRFLRELKKIGRQRSATRIEQSGLSQIQEQLIALRGAIAGAAGGLLTDAERLAFDDEIAGTLEAIERTRELFEGFTTKPSARLDSAARDFDSFDSSNLEPAAADIDGRIDEVSFSRAALAAYDKYELDVQEQLLQDQIAIHGEALSQVEDADFAEEASKLAAAQILAEASMAALAVSGKEHAEQVEAVLEGARDGVEKTAV
jgi:flagellin